MQPRLQCRVLFLGADCCDCIQHWALTCILFLPLQVYLYTPQTRNPLYRTFAARAVLRDSTDLAEGPSSEVGAMHCRYSGSNNSTAMSMVCVESWVALDPFALGPGEARVTLLYIMPGITSRLHASRPYQASTVLRCQDAFHAIRQTHAVTSTV
jgi:hypothetical protein